MQLHIIQIVRRFGPVGGMETYVWRLANGLAERGHSVSVICECVMGEVPPNIECWKVDMAQERRRWKSMRVFQERVDALLKDRFKNRKVIIHSHERSISHHVTTFHGPPIQQSDNLGWLSLLSPRIRGWKQMESHELLSTQVQCVIPVSSKVQEALLTDYPQLRAKRLQLGWPGVNITADHQLRDSFDIDKAQFVFVGKEWKRKGLLRAIDIVEKYRKTYPQAGLDVYGVDLSSLPKAMNRLTWVRFKGWATRIPWTQYDVLVHPARKEPFGMVVAEARAHGVAVLMSDRVGAADLSLDCVGIVAIDASLRDWVKELNSLMALCNRSSEVKWTWDELVDLHCQTIYPNINLELS